MVFKDRRALAAAALAATALLGGPCLEPAAAQSPKGGVPKLPRLDDAHIVGLLTRQLASKKAGQKEVMVLKLQGPFVDRGIDGTAISPYAITLMLAICKDRRPDAIVLDVSSPGGLVLAMDDIVDQLLKVQTEDKLRVIAWPQDAHSAAAVTCLACKELVVRPISQLGAATKVLGVDEAPKAKTAMDQKVKSATDARRRTIANVTGRDLRVLDAMQFPERKLWFKAGVGFSDKPPMGDGWSELDGSEETPATLNADEMVRTGIALASKAVDNSELLAAIKLPADTTVTILDLQDQRMQAALKPTIDAVALWFSYRDEQVAAFQKKVTDKVKRYDEVIQDLEALKPGWKQKDLESIQRKVENCEKLPILSAELRELVAGTAWLDCLERSFESAKLSASFAKAAIRPRSTGSGLTLDAGKTREHLVQAHNDLVDFLKGCPEE
jgi:hypothetical protein